MYIDHCYMLLCTSKRKLKATVLGRTRQLVCDTVSSHESLVLLSYVNQCLFYFVNIHSSSSLHVRDV